MNHLDKVITLPIELVHEIAGYLEKKTASDAIQYHNRYGAERPELQVSISSDQIMWHYSRPNEIINGCTATLDRTTTMCILEELSKMIVKDQSIQFRLDCESVTKSSLQIRYQNLFGFWMGQVQVASRFAHVTSLCSLANLMYSDNQQLVSVVLNIQSSSL